MIESLNINTYPSILDKANFATQSILIDNKMKYEYLSLYS